MVSASLTNSPPPPPDGGPPPLSVEAINGNFSLNSQGYNKPLLLRRGGTA